MASKSFELKQIIEQIDKFANFFIYQGKTDRNKYYISFEYYDSPNGWRLALYSYDKAYLFKTWKENTDRDIDYYIRYTKRYGQYKADKIK